MSGRYRPNLRGKVPLELHEAITRAFDLLYQLQDQIPSTPRLDLPGSRVLAEEEKPSNALESDLDSPSTVTATAQWQRGVGLLVKISKPTKGTIIHDYELAFFHPSTANGTTVARNFFNPDTGAAIAPYSSASPSATFGRSGTAGFFTGGSRRFQGHAHKRQMPAGALSGGIGILARAYNFITGGQDPEESTNPSSSSGFATMSATTTFSFAAGDEDQDFQVPTNVVISAVASDSTPSPGDKGEAFDTTLTLTWDGQSDTAVVEVTRTDNGRVFKEHFDALGEFGSVGNSAAIRFAKKSFKKGTSISIRAKVKNGNKASDWVSFTGNPFIVGSGFATIPGPTSIALDENKKREALVTANWGLNADLRWLQPFKNGVKFGPPMSISSPGSSGDETSTITSHQFGVRHAQDASITIDAQLIDKFGQKSAIPSGIAINTGTPDGSDDPTPGAPTLISVSSAIDDIPGTKGIEASASVTVGLAAANQTSIEVVITNNSNGKKYREKLPLVGTETSAVIDFDRTFKVGQSLTITKLRLWNRSAFIDTNNPAGGTFTASSTIARPAAPSLSVVKRFTKKTKYLATLGAADTNVRQLQIWSKANPAGAAPTDNDPNPAGWTHEKSKDVKGPAKAGATTFNFTIHHQQSERPDIVARFVNSNGDLGTWSAILDAGATPETDAAAPTAVTITSATSDADPLPNNTGRQFIVSVGVSWSGPANQVDGKITVNSKDHVEHVPVDTITGSTGNTATIVFSRMFKQGQSGTIQVRVRNANAKSAWVAYASNPLIIGGSGGTLASPSITQFERNPYNAIYAVTWTPNADLAYLHVQKQKTDLSWVDQPKVDITSVATVGAVHVSIEVKGALANTTVFPNVRVRLQDTSGNLSAWVQLNGASQPSGTEFYMDDPTGWFDSGKLGLIGTGASANLNTVVSQRNDGNKTLVPNLTDAVWPAPLASQAAAIDTVTGHFKSNIPNGQVVTYMEAGNMRIAIFNAGDGLWYRFNAATSIGGGSSGTPSDPPPGDGGTCFALDSFVLAVDGSLRMLRDVQIDDEILGIDMKTGQEIMQRVMGIIHHDPAEFIVWNFLRMAEHLLCRWCPNPYQPEQIKPPGLSDWLQPRSIHLGQQFWSRTANGVIGPFTHSSTSAGSGMIALASLMTSGKTYWIGDGQQFVLAHNTKVLS